MRPSAVVAVRSKCNRTPSPNPERVIECTEWLPVLRGSLSSLGGFLEIRCARTSLRSKVCEEKSPTPLDSPVAALLLRGF